MLSKRINRARLSLLIVEDDEINQDVIRQQVELLGFEAVVVGSGREALDALAKKDFDVVLMDCRMPGMDGYETARRIREREGAAKRIPIIALTGSVLEGEREKCLAAGMDDYLAKPIELEELQAVVMRWRMPERSVESSEQRQQSDTSTPVDFKRLLRVSGSTRAGLREMFDTYLRKTAEELSRLKAAVHAQSPGEVERYAHNCAGASVICGITALVAPLREMESLGRSGDLHPAGELYLHIEREFERVKNYLKEQLN